MTDTPWMRNWLWCADWSQGMQHQKGHVDRGYRGNNHQDPETIIVDKRCWGTIPKRVWKGMKRRAASNRPSHTSRPNTDWSAIASKARRAMPSMPCSVPPP